MKIKSIKALTLLILLLLFVFAAACGKTSGNKGEGPTAARKQDDNIQK